MAVAVLAVAAAPVAITALAGVGLSEALASSIVAGAATGALTGTVSGAVEGGLKDGAEGALVGGLSGGVSGATTGALLGPIAGPISSVLAGGVGGFGGDLAGQIVGNYLQNTPCPTINWQTPIINLFAGMLGPLVGNMAEASLTANLSAEAAEQSGASGVANAAGQISVAPAQGIATYGGDTGNN